MPDSVSVDAALRVIGIVPARGGSKGIPRKNLAAVGGATLLEHTLRAATASSLLSRMIVSTDDDEIADVARRAGADVPFMRPVQLALDDTPTLPVLAHALATVEPSDGRYDAVVLLQPTCPLRSADDIDRCVRLLVERDAASVVSVVDVGGNHPFRMKRLLDDGRLINLIDQGFEDMRPRQSLPPVYIRNGAVYATRREVIDAGSIVGEPCFGYVMPWDRSVNVDGPLDLALAEHLLAP